VGRDDARDDDDDDEDGFGNDRGSLGSLAGSGTIQGARPADDERR